MDRKQVPDADYPSPARLPRPWGLLAPLAVACGVELLVLGSSVGYVVGGVPLVAGLFAIEHRARHMRDAALADLKAHATSMDRTEVEHRLEIILRVYGGAPFPSVKERVARIRRFS